MNTSHDIAACKDMQGAMLVHPMLLAEMAFRLRGLCHDHVQDFNGGFSRECVCVITS